MRRALNNWEKYYAPQYSTEKDLSPEKDDEDVEENVLNKAATPKVATASLGKDEF